MMNDLARAMRRWTEKKHHNLNHVLAVVTPLSRPRGEVGILFFSEPVAFRRVYGLESHSRTSGW